MNAVGNSYKSGRRPSPEARDNPGPPEEAGVPGFEVAGWYGLIGPAGMPQALVARINHEINAILTVPEMRDQLSMQGADPRTATPEEFAAAMASDMKKWAKVVAAAGIKPQ